MIEFLSMTGESIFFVAVSVFAFCLIAFVVFGVALFVISGWD